jgi:aliphatic nitrilase
MPTVGERLVHMGGYRRHVRRVPDRVRPDERLICGENSNPLAVFALTAEGTRIHVMSWPNHFPTSGDPLRNRVAVDSQAFAQMSKAFVISACGTVDERMIEMLEPSPRPRSSCADPDCSGGSVIVARTAASSPARWAPRKGILYAECNLELASR